MAAVLSQVPPLIFTFFESLYPDALIEEESKEDGTYYYASSSRPEPSIFLENGSGSVYIEWLNKDELEGEPYSLQGLASATRELFNSFRDQRNPASACFRVTAPETLGRSRFKKLLPKAFYNSNIDRSEDTGQWVANFYVTRPNQKK